MSEQKPNTICRICGKEYYACKTCSEIGSWRAVACCQEHYVQYVDMVFADRNKNEINTVKEEVVVEATDKIITGKAISKKFDRKNIGEKAV